MNKLLTDKIAIVTGGTAGIGKAIAMKYAEAGAHVIIFGSHQERGNQAVKDIQNELQEAQVDFLKVDIADGVAIAVAIKAVLDKHGRIDILVNNAGITRDQLLMKMTDEEWDSVIATNLTSCFHTCKAVVRAMLKAKKGRIINVSSVVGVCGNPGQTNYAASKAGMIGFTLSLAKELASRQISVNSIAPGFIDTQMTGKLSEQQRQGAIDKIPFARFGLPEEVANVALFLASDLSSYMTGQVIAVDGGMLMG